MSDTDWHDWRRAGIGGSDVPGILGLSSFSSPYKVWAEKVGLLPPTEATQRQRIGLRMEAVLAEEFHDDTDLYVTGQQTWCELREERWARCTVDGFVIEHAPAEQWPDDIAAVATWQAKTDGRFGWPDGVPANIRSQCIWEMGVTGLEHCWLTVMFAGFRIEHFELDWDADARADWVFMLDRAERFWHDHVLTGVPPEVDGSDATAAALATIWPEHDPGETVDLTDLAGILTERADLKETIKTDKARLAEIENTIRARFGTAEVGTVAGVDFLTYRSSERAGYTVEPTTVRTLRSAPKPKKKGTP